jgi:protein involved in polysaccharide export with SLBB domain
VIRTVVILLACLALGGPGVASSAQVQEVATDTLAMDWSRVPEYRIVPGDKLLLDMGPRVDAPMDYRHEQVVRPDGRITVFPVGDVIAAGLTPMELQRNVTDLLAADLRSPRITVELVSSASNLVHVLGRVRRPGSVPAGAFMTVSQAIAGAEGFADDAARNSVVVIRRNGANSVSVAVVPMDRVLNGVEFADIPLGRFDIVYVPRTTVGNLSVFLTQIFTPLAPMMTTALIGWELFHFDQIYVKPGTP